MTQEFYALGSDRSVAFALAFLNHHLPHRKPCSDDHPVPQYADVPERVFHTEPEILGWLERNPDERYSLYWDDATRGSQLQAMLFYTTDGAVVFGLAEESASPDERLKELATFVGARYAMIGWEAPPPDTSRGFIALCRGAGG